MITIQFRDENNEIIIERKKNFDIELKREIVKQMPTSIKSEEKYLKCAELIKGDYKIIITK